MHKNSNKKAVHLRVLTLRLVIVSTASLDSVRSLASHISEQSHTSSYAIKERSSLSNG